MADDKKTMVIMGQSYSIDDKNVATPLAFSVDQERQWHDKPESRPPEYLVKKGVVYRIYDDVMDYVNNLRDGGARTYVGHKSARVFAKFDSEKNNWLVKAVDSNGDIALDDNGREDAWHVSDKMFRLKYDADNISENHIASPRNVYQEFIRIDKNIAVSVPWGNDGSVLYQALDEGDYLNITDPCDIYGLHADDIAKTYSFDNPLPAARRSIEAVVSAAAAAETDIENNNISEEAEVC